MKFRNLKFNLYAKTLLLFLLGCLFLLAGCGQNKDVIAEFKGGVVLKHEYIDKFLSSNMYKPDVFPDRSNLKEIVEQIVYDKLVATEAKSQGLDSDSMFIALKAKNELKIIYQNWVQQNIVNKVITDSLVQKYYDEFSPQYKMSYIIRPIFKTSKPELVKSQKDTIEFVYKLLKQGKKFPDLAKKYSQDFTTSHKGGEIGFVIRESLGDEELRAVMDTLKIDNYSQPVRGYEGFYILHKGEKRISQPPEFSVAKPIIVRGLMHNRQHIINDKIEEKFNAVKADYGYKFSSETYNKIVTTVGGDTSGSDNQSLDFTKLTEEDLLLNLGSYNNKEFNVFDVLRERKRVPETLKHFRELVTKYSQRVVLAEYAKSQNFQKTPAAMDEITEMENSVLKSLFYENNIKTVAKAKIDSLKETLDPDFKGRALVIRREGLKIEKEVSAGVQAKLLKKYKFKLVEANVPQVLEEARSKKLLQNEEQAKQKAKQ